MHENHEELHDTEQIRTHDILLLTYTKNDGYLCLNRNHERDPLQAMVRLPRENTEFPSYTSLWEIEKQPVTEISPFPDKKKQLGV